MKAKHCGSCRHFKNEDINGDGWCEKYDAPTHCGKECLKLRYNEYRTDRR